MEQCTCSSTPDPKPLVGIRCTRLPDVYHRHGAKRLVFLHRSIEHRMLDNKINCSS